MHFEDPTNMKERDLFSSTDPVMQQRLTSLERMLALERLRVVVGCNKHPMFKAMDYHKELVMTEASPEKFFKANDLDVDLTVKRMMAYWDTRVKILGDFAYKPIRDMQGLLAEVASNETKQLLPFDNNSRSVVYVSHPKGANVDSPMELRHLFTTLQLASENPVSQADGIVVVHNVEHFGKENGAEAARLVCSSMPARVWRYVVVCATNKTELTVTKIPEIVGVLSSVKPQVQLRVIVTATPVDTMNELKEEGISHLPCALGGKIDVEKQRQLFFKLTSKTYATAADNANLLALARNALASYLGSKLSSSVSDSCSAAQSHPAPTATSDEGGARSELDEAEIRIDQMKSPDIALQRLEEAVEFIADEAKQAYKEAKQVVPHLVKAESNPLWYLQVENYNVWSAARRLGSYWRYRRLLFAERAYYPMLIADHARSALTDTDRAIIRVGLFCMGPPDSYRRPVASFNRGRIAGNKYEEPQFAVNRKRALFYLLQIAAEQEASRKEGVSFIVDFGRKKPKYNTNDHSVQFAKKMIETGSFPVCVQAVHMIVRPIKGKVLPATLGKVTPMLQKCKDTPYKLKLHVNPDPKELFKILESYGFRKASLYPALGGTWSYKRDHAGWFEFRSYLEGIKHGSPIDHTLEGQVGEIRTIADFQTAKKRKLNAFHARNMRKRHRIEESVLDNQVKERQRENSVLRMENQRLETLLSEAKMFELEILRSRLPRVLAINTFMKNSYV